MKNFLKKIFGEPNRKLIKNVLPGEEIRIEWNRILGEIGCLKCISNDPKTKKILLEVEWNDYEKHGLQQKEYLLLNYKDKHLKNFHLLNSFTISEDLNSLTKKLNEAISKDEFEIAANIRSKIDRLKNI